MEAFFAAIAWPIAVFSIVALFMLLFRTSIDALIMRTKSFSAGKDGVSTQGLEQQKVEAVAATVAAAALPAGESPDVAAVAEKPEPERIGEVAHRLMLNIADSAPLTANIDSFRADLESRGLDVSSDASKVLLRYVSAAYMWLNFEQVYLSIFGSQIQLLKDLNQSKGRPVDYVESYVEITKAIHTELATWTTDQYLNFLITHGFMQLDGTVWRLTPLGSEFLVWMVRIGRSETKGF